MRHADSWIKIPGLCFLACGYSRESFHFNSTTNSITSQLAVFGSIISSLLYTFSAPQNRPSPEIEAKVLLLSRDSSVALLIMSLVWFTFRYRSHPYLFMINSRDGYHDDEDQFEPTLTPLSNIVVAVICILLLAVQADSIVLSLNRMAPEVRPGLVMYFIPVFLPISKHIRALRFALQGNIDDSLDLTLGFAVTLCLFLGPLLVILSWCMGVALTLRFNSFDTITYGLSAWIMTYTVTNGRSNWLEGAGLLIM